MTEQLDQTTGELVPVSHHQATRTVDLRDRSTDSWTDVFPDAVELARGIADTEFVPKGLRGSVAKTTGAILYARELGLPPMTGLGSTHVIEGKAGISAEMMRALILARGHELVVKESNRDRCEMWGRRKGQEEWTKAVFTIEEANQIQVFISKDKGWGPLSSKSQWLSWRAEMLLARCTTRIARMVFPDVISGMRSVEELQDMTTEEVVEGEVVQPPQPAAAAPVQRKRAPLRKPSAAAQKEPEPDQQEEAQETPDEPQQAAQPAPVARQRMPRPEPRKAPEPAAKAQPKQEEPKPAVEATVDTLPEQPEIVDAEVVEEPKQEPKSEPEKLEDYQNRVRKAVQIDARKQFERLGISDRAERLYYTGEITGKKVTTTNDLTIEELRELVHVLGKCRDLKALDKYLDEKRQGGETK